MEKVIIYERTPFYYETDRMGVIHHSNYIRWFEEARVHFMEKAGYPYSRMEEEGMMMPVLSVGCEYKIPVRFGDIVLIDTAITKFNGIKMELQYLVINNTGNLCVKGSSSHCITDSSMKPIRINRTNPELYELYRSYVSEKLF